jgi:hypothetical protein
MGIFTLHLQPTQRFVKAANGQMYRVFIGQGENGTKVEVLVYCVGVVERDLDQIGQVLSDMPPTSVENMGKETKVSETVH